MRPGTSLQSLERPGGGGRAESSFYDGAASVDLKRVFCACEDNTIREFGQKAVGQTAVTEFSPLAAIKTSESVGSLTTR